MADTAAYAEQARRIADEIFDSFQSNPARAGELDAQLRRMSVADWFRWREDAADLTARFAAATPSARRRRRWPEPVALLHLAAYQHCLEAAALLQETDVIGPGRSWRGTLQPAASAAHAIAEQVKWIRVEGFDGEVCPFRDLPAGDD